MELIEQRVCLLEGLPLSASVMSDADAFEMAQPVP
jgi:hypothetical protein